MRRRDPTLHRNSFLAHDFDFLVPRLVAYDCLGTTRRIPWDEATHMMSWSLMIMRPVFFADSSWESSKPLQFSNCGALPCASVILHGASSSIRGASRVSSRPEMSEAQTDTTGTQLTRSTNCGVRRDIEDRGRSGLLLGRYRLYTMKHLHQNEQ